jgi:hypothetical protein
MIEKLLRRAGASLAVALAVTLTAGAAQASAAAPIEGVWNFESGQVRVSANANGTFTGIVVAPTEFADCSHPAGDVIWQITGSGEDYTGTHEWLNPPKSDCSPAGLGEATWTITAAGSTEETMTFCTAAPNSGPVDPTASPGHPVGKTRCYALSQTVTAPSEPSAPTNLAAPVISGTAAVADTLSCSTGSWSDSPTGYAYSWQRNGSAIAGATLATYTAQPTDQDATITCAVVATNDGGASAAATSAGVQVPSLSAPTGKTRAGCPAATGRLSGRRLGNIRLGMTRSRARRAYRRSHDRHTRFRDVFCLNPHGVQVGYATTRIDRTLSRKAARGLRGRVIWVTTANPRYSIHGVHPGATLAAARRHLKLGRATHVPHASWYLIRFGRGTALFKVSRGKVREIGIADTRLTRPPTRRALLDGLV